MWLASVEILWKCHDSCAAQKWSKSVYSINDNKKNAKFTCVWFLSKWRYLTVSPRMQFQWPNLLFDWHFRLIFFAKMSKWSLKSTCRGWFSNRIWWFRPLNEARQRTTDGLRGLILHIEVVQYTYFWEIYNLRSES